MTYYTTKAIRDLEDNKHYYDKGEEFPRKGFKPSQERLDDLTKRGYLVKEEKLEDLTKKELLEIAETQGVETNSKDTKAEIIDKLGG